jgi:GAF domain-containing protein
MSHEDPIAREPDLPDAGAAEPPERDRLRAALEARARELADAVEQQQATSEILRVISRAPLEVPFGKIVAAAKRLCSASAANLFTFDGEQLHIAALTMDSAEGEATLRRHFPRPPSRGMAASRAVLTRRLVAIHDTLADPEYEWAAAPRWGFRSILGVPLLRDGSPIGAITVGRPVPGPFPESQVALLQTFADQAVIALENVRLFREVEARNRQLTEAVEQQTATSEILRVISRSHTDVPFATIAATARKLFAAASANIFTFDGEQIHVAALAVESPEGAATISAMFPRGPDRAVAVGRAILARRVVAIDDAFEDPEYQLKGAERWGFRSVLAVPLVRDGEPVGAIAVGRHEPGAFTPNQVALLQTFADQAVIAIENVRLFTELETRNRELTEALEQQTATGEILRVISRSHSEVPFDTIAAVARRLFRATSVNIFTFDGERIHVAALAIDDPAGAAAIRGIYPRPPGRGSASARAVLTGGVVQIPDATEDPDYDFKEAARYGFRSILAIPLVREGRPVGVITVGRREPGPFTDKQVAVLQTFADQAVIAIENVRLFTELETRTTELARSVEQLRALSEVGQAVSSTLDLETVLRTIVSRAAQLASMDAGAIYEYEEAGQEFRLHAAHELPDELVEALRATAIPRGEGAVGRLATTGEPVAISDIQDAAMYQSRVRELLLRLGYRSLLAVPLLREDRLIGGLVVNRKIPGAFDPHVVDLLRSFATQSAVAIQNARLYREIEEKSRQLEVASRHKSAFLANMSHELRTPLNAIIGFTRIVARRAQDRLEPKQLENLERILSSAQHLLSLINAILDLAKVEAGRVELRPSEVQLPALLDQCMRTVEPLLRESVAQVRAFGPDLPVVVADEEKLRQIVMNLLSNAAKFTASGRIEVRARAADGAVELQVADTGIGIAPEKLGAVFEEFEQAHPRHGVEYGGTGLGLAISRRLARLMGGDIRAESVPGAGSTFTLTLPVRGPPPS